jgi:hypothetical protein
MKPVKGWRQIRANLREQPAPVARRDPDAFWSDFRARARLMRQEQPVVVPLWRSMPMRVAYAAAVVALLAAGLALMLPGGGAGLPNRIKSLEVVASHSGVIIINDDTQRGTILWIADLQPDGSG